MEELPEITRARKLKDFFMEWGMDERDAKKTALAVVFNITDCYSLDNEKIDVLDTLEAIEMAIKKTNHSV